MKDMKILSKCNNDLQTTKNAYSYKEVSLSVIIVNPKYMSSSKIETHENNYQFSTDSLYKLCVFLKK